MPESEASANASCSGVVSTPPKSEMTARSSGMTDHVVAADALVAAHVPGEEGAVEPQLPEVERRAAEQPAGGAAWVAVVLSQPQLEAGTALAPIGVVGRRDARVVEVDVGLAVEQHAPASLGVVALLAVRADGGDGHAAAVVEPGGERARGVELAPVGLSPGVRALPEAVDGQLATAGPCGARDAAELLVADHAAGAGGGLGAVELGRRAERLEGQPEARPGVVVVGDAPLTQRRVHGGAQPTQREVGEIGAAGQLDPAARGGGHRLRAGE